MRVKRIKKQFPVRETKTSRFCRPYFSYEKLTRITKKPFTKFNRLHEFQLNEKFEVLTYLRYLRTTDTRENHSVLHLAPKFVAKPRRSIPFNSDYQLGAVVGDSWGPLGWGSLVGVGGGGLGLVLFCFIQCLIFVYIYKNQKISKLNL